jgi:hypothetical protein
VPLFSSGGALVFYPQWELMYQLFLKETSGDKEKLLGRKPGGSLQAAA